MASLFAKEQLFQSVRRQLRRDSSRCTESVELAEIDDGTAGMTCCPLPFFLQDLCLLVVINELDHYPTELLAALPYSIRYRLLNSVPALDLARLEHTLVIRGVDIREIWESRCLSVTDECSTRVQYRYINGSTASDAESPSEESPFELNVSRDIDRQLYTPNNKYHGGNTLTQDIMKELDSTKGSELSIGKHHLLKTASGLLTSSLYGRNFTRLEKATRQLVSVSGNLVLSNLLVGAMHQHCQNPLCSQEAWKKQVTALVLKELTTRVNSHPYIYHNYIDYRRQYVTSTVSTVYLIPRRLLPFYDKPDPIELLSLLSKDFGLHPRVVNIHIDVISESFLPNLHAERLALDNNLCLPTKGALHTSIISHLLENVVSLRLQCDQYNLICVMVSMVKAAIANGQASNLKHLICTLPDLYMDIIDTLCALFSLPNFYMLSLDLSDVYPLMLSKLLRVFITTPCLHTHKLLLHATRSRRSQIMIKENQVAAMDMQGLTIPSCSLQHKVLKFSSNEDLTEGLCLLLQFPKIQLKELTLFSNNKYLHLCAVHPHLQITKLTIIVVGNARQQFQRKRPRHITTLQQDILSLLKMKSLQKVCIQGNWGPMIEVKLGLLFGLQARIHLPPLKKLSLELKSQNSYEVQDFAILCDTLFSLPQLENLKLVLGEGFADIIREHEDVIYKSWSDKGGGVWLKSVSLRTYIEADFKKLALITENISLLLLQRQSGAYCNSSIYEDYYYCDSDDDDVPVYYDF